MAGRKSSSGKKMSVKERNESIKAERQDILNTILDDMEKDGSDWVKSWSVPTPPLNGSTGTEYHGRNTLMLLHSMRTQGFKDPRFVTFLQAKNLGTNPVKGSHGTKIEHWGQYFVDRTGEKPIYKRVPKSQEEAQKFLDEHPTFGKRPELHVDKMTTVFNAEQLADPDKLLPVKTFDDIEPDRIADALVKASPCPVDETISPDAYYMPAMDRITVPQRNQFVNIESFCRTLLHEQGHATGAATRLNRPQHGFKDDPKAYAFEELVAELSCVFTANEIGLDLKAVSGDKPLGPGEADSLKNHAAYLKSWASEFEEPAEQLFLAATQANRATDYLVEQCFEPTLGKDFFRGQEQTIEQGQDGPESADKAEEIMDKVSEGVEVKESENGGLEAQTAGDGEQETISVLMEVDATCKYATYDVPATWLEAHSPEWESAEDFAKNITQEESVSLYQTALADGVVTNDEVAEAAGDEHEESLDEMMSAKATEAEIGQDAANELENAEQERE